MLSQWKGPQSQAVELESLSHALLQQLPSLPRVDYEKSLRQTFSDHKKQAIMRLFQVSVIILKRELQKRRCYSLKAKKLTMKFLTFSGLQKLP